MKQKLFEMVQVTVFFSYKNGNGRQTAPRVPKLGYFDGRVPKLSSRVTHASSGAGVVCHIKNLCFVGGAWSIFLAFFLVFFSLVTNNHN